MNGQKHPLAVAWFALLLLVLAWDASGLDVAVMQLIGTAQGFTWRHAPLLETVLHDDLRQLASIALIALWVWALLPLRRAAVPRRERLAVAALATLGLLAVNLVKNASATSCPWDWQAFGGSVPAVSHWAWGVLDGGPGRCFPGGHASSGMAFLALALPWVRPLGDTPRTRVIGWIWLAVALFTGLLAGVVQTLRGAHPPSHTGWTLLICLGVALAGWELLHLRQRRALPAQAQAQG